MNLILLGSYIAVAMVLFTIDIYRTKKAGIAKTPTIVASFILATSWPIVIVFIIIMALTKSRNDKK